MQTKSFFPQYIPIATLSSILTLCSLSFSKEAIEPLAMNSQAIKSEIDDLFTPTSAATNVVAEETNVVAEETNVVAEETNVVAEETNVVAEETNVVAEETNVVAEETNVVAEETNPVAEDESLFVVSDLASATTKAVSEKPMRSEAFSIALKPDEIHYSIPNTLSDAKIELLTLDGSVLSTAEHSKDEIGGSFDTAKLDEGYYIVRLTDTTQKELRMARAVAIKH